MPHKDADAHQKQGQEVRAVGGLQENEQEYAEVYENQEVQIRTGAYLVFEPADNAMRRADNEQDEQIAERNELPRLEVFDGIRQPEMSQLDKWLVEQLHLVVEERMTEQKPIRNTQSEQCSAKTAGGERLEVISSYQPEGNEI